ncbi:MAG: hypothetical protein WC297_03780 [Candidatus Paceibacterota bacterium]
MTEKELKLLEKISKWIHQKSLKERGLRVQDIDEYFNKLRVQSRIDKYFNE